MNINISVRLMGAPLIEVNGVSVRLKRKKSLALLAYLLLAERPLQRDFIANFFWEESNQQNSRNALRVSLAELREILGESLIADRNTLYVTRLTTLSVDIWHFQQAIAEQAYHEAVAVYRDGFMTGFNLSDISAFDQWQHQQEEQLAGDVRQAFQWLALDYAQQGAFEQSLSHALRLQQISPDNGQICRLIMGLYSLLGKQNNALAHFNEYARVLRQDFYTTPSAEVIQLFNHIQKGTLLTLKDIVGYAPSRIPLPGKPQRMVGREQDLATLKQQIQTSPRAIVIQGLPGIGKSTLMAALAYDDDLNKRFPDGILWASLGQNPNLLEHLLIWARAFQLITDNQSPDEIRNQLIALLKDRQVLLLIDDAWESQHAHFLMVGGGTAQTVISTRLPHVADELGENRYKLSVLSSAAGLELLQSLSPQTVENHPAEARLLVENLEGLPLAIQVAGRLLAIEASLGWGVQELLAELSEGTKLLGETIPADMHHSPYTPTPTIQVLFKRSTDLLSTEMQTYFALLGLFAPKPATFDLKATGALWEVEDPRPILRNLVARGLLEAIGDGRFQMHAMLVAHARTLFEQEG